MSIHSIFITWKNLCQGIF